MREQIAEKIAQFHKDHNGGKIPVYEGVVVLDNTFTTKDRDAEVLTLVFVSNNNIEDIKHITLEAALHLVEAIDSLFDMDEEDDEDDEFGRDGDDDESGEFDLDDE